LSKYESFETLHEFWTDFVKKSIDPDCGIQQMKNLRTTFFFGAAAFLNLVSKSKKLLAEGDQEKALKIMKNAYKEIANILKMNG
jgi:hypothetical protein